MNVVNWPEIMGGAPQLKTDAAISPTQTPLPIIKKTPEAEHLAQEMEKAKRVLVDKEERERKVMSSLFQINHKMKKIETEQSNLIQQRMALESASGQLAEKILILEDKLKVKRVALRERLVAIYKMGGQGLARLLFSSQNSSQLEKNLKIMGIVAHKDLELMKDFSAHRNELKEQKEKLQLRLAKIQKLQKKIEGQEKILAQDNELKFKILNKIKSSQKTTISYLENLRSQSKKMAGAQDEGVLDLLFRPSFFEQKSRLPWPVADERVHIAQKFGVLHDEEHNLTLPHKGIVLATVPATPIQSVFEGSVVYVGELEGYGSTIILDHGDHYYTVYSGASQVQVKLGEDVKQNQQIALSGVLPESGVEGLYFEVRHFSEPHDPRSWLKGIPL